MHVFDGIPVNIVALPAFDDAQQFAKYPRRWGRVRSGHYCSRDENFHKHQLGALLQHVYRATSRHIRRAPSPPPTLNVVTQQEGNRFLTRERLRVWWIKHRQGSIPIIERDESHACPAYASSSEPGADVSLANALLLLLRQRRGAPCVSLAARRIGVQRVRRRA